MAIDVFSEKVVTLKEATALLPRTARNKRLHVGTPLGKLEASVQGAAVSAERAEPT